MEAATDHNDQGGLANFGARGGRDRRAQGSVLLFLGSSPFAPVIIIEIIGSGEFKQENKLTVIVHKDGVRGEPLKPGDRRAGEERLERGVSVGESREEVTYAGTPALGELWASRAEDMPNTFEYGIVGCSNGIAE